MYRGRFLLVVLMSYLIVVLIAELAIWHIQPVMDGGLTVSVSVRGEDRLERKLAGYEFNGELYVSSNHWFRSWYYAALEEPVVELKYGDQTELRRAIQVSGAEHEKVNKDYEMGFILRLICGFAPSKFLRLEKMRPVDLSVVSFWH